MRWDIFLAAMQELYATFGKSAPTGGPVLEAIYRRVSELPEGFLAYAMDRMQDMERLPANIGAYLRRDLWPDYLESHPELRAQNHDRPGCPRCRHDYPAVKSYWEKDGTVHLCACDCCTDQSLIDLMGRRSDYELVQAGFLLERPEYAVVHSTLDELHRTLAAKSERRERQYMEEVEL